MAWCGTPGCGKRNLHGDEVVFDDEAQIVRCLPCYERAQQVHSEAPKDMQYQISLSNVDGLVAKANIKGLIFSAAIPAETLRNLVTRRRALGVVA